MTSRIYLSLCLLLSLLVQPAFAAKFKSISKMKDPALQALAHEMTDLQEDEIVFGDCSSVSMFSFKRKEEELDLNTAKQLNIMKGGIWAGEEDEGYGFNNKTPEYIVDAVLKTISKYIEDSESGKIMKRAKKDLTHLVDKIDRNSAMKFFGAFHANEDGSWNVLDVIDTKNNQVLLVRFGRCGT